MSWPRVLLAAYVFVWFNLVVPGHTRGIITMPCCAAESAAEPSATDSAPAKPKPSCCSVKTPAKPTPPQTPGKPTPEQAARCAICFVAATYTAPDSVAFFVPVISLEHAAYVPRLIRSTAAPTPLPIWTTGPPATA